MNKLFYFIFFFSLSLNVAAQLEVKTPEDLDHLFQRMADRGYIAGFGVSVFTNEKVLYQKGFGYSDVENKIPYTIKTRQLIASISKTTISIALMKVQELGLLELDDPINQHLPFKVVNPFFPNDPITLRHLAKHSSSFKYSEAMTDDLVYKNPDMDLEDLLRAFLTPSGKWYSESNFHKAKPGRITDYSNTGAQLAALVVECITKMPFSHFTKVQIFDPLQMKKTDWYKGKSEKELTKHYKFIAKDEMEEYPRVKTDGDLVSTVEDMTRYCQAIMNLAKAKKGNILSKASMKEMMTFTKKKTVDEEKVRTGIFWDKAKHQLGIPRMLIGHNGGDWGIYTMMYYDPKKNIGYILMCNTDKADYFGTDGEGAHMTLTILYRSLYKFAKHTMKQS